MGGEGLKTRIQVGLTWGARGKDPSRVSSIEGRAGRTGTLAQQTLTVQLGLLEFLRKSVSI